MSSLLTNESSMVALTTLRYINKNLAMVQSEISTGKSVANARDNAALWAVSTVMQSDVDSFKSISDSLSLGSSTIAVARGAAEQVTSLLQEVKTLVVAAQEENVDRSKIQTDVAELRNQITSIVNAAQFNGLNLLKGGGNVQILASLDRASDGSVTASNISVNKSDLQVVAQTIGTGAATITGTLAGDTAGDIAVGDTATVTYAAAALTEGESFTISLGGTDFSYVARENDSLNDVVRNLSSQLRGAFPDVTVSFTNVGDPEAEDSFISITNGSDAAIAVAQAVASGGTAGGALGGLVDIDVSTDEGAETALAAIEGLIQAGIDASAAFGSAQKRIDIQGEFVTNLMDALRSGIGALTDADLEEASARLQSLQVQQQLGIQALSIANQQPQALLGLFR